MVVYLVFGVTVALTAAWYVQLWQNVRATSRAPVVQVAARVVTTYSGHARGFRDSSLERKMAHYAVFELRNGNRKKFDVGRCQVSEGATGILTYQREQFFGFHR